MTSQEVTSTLLEYAGLYPALITFAQAAEIAHAKLATVYDQSSRGLFDQFKSKSGRGALLQRDAFVRFVMRPDHAPETTS